MKVFVAAVDTGSLAGAVRKLARSAAAVSRAIAVLEDHVGARLLLRTTRTLRLTEAGEHYVAACRRVLAELGEADMLLAQDKAAPSGMLTLTAPVAGGEEILLPMIDAFLDAVPGVSVTLHLLDRPASLIEEGIDLALRFAHLPDSTLVAMRVGQVRRVICAAPSYLAGHPPIETPADLASHKIIAMTHFGLDGWAFPPAPGGTVPRSVRFTPRLVVNSVRGAAASAVQGHGVTRLFSYHVAPHVHDGTLRIILQGDEPPPLPVHLIAPHGRLSVPKVRAFTDFAVPRLRAWFAARG